MHRALSGYRCTVMGVTFISYAFNLNLGPLVGAGLPSGIASTRSLGLDNNTITRVLGFSMLTNWFATSWSRAQPLLLAHVLAARLEDRQRGPAHPGRGNCCWRGVAYLALCAIAREHTWHIRNHDLDTPPLRIALLQLAMSCGNWCLMGGVIWILMQEQVAYPTVLAVFLVAAVAGVITHVPGGLGVLEAVFIALLGHVVPEGRLLGALLAYRAIYYLLPLIVASLFYVATELRASGCAGPVQRRSPDASG